MGSCHEKVEVGVHFFVVDDDCFTRLLRKHVYACKL